MLWVDIKARRGQGQPQHAWPILGVSPGLKEKGAPKWTLPKDLSNNAEAYIMRWMMRWAWSSLRPRGRWARGPSLESTGSASTKETDSFWKNRPV